MRIGAATFQVFVPQLFSVLCRTGVSVITARVLGPEGRGVYAVFVSVVAMLGALLSLGISQSNIYHVNKGAPKPALLGNSLVFLAFAAAALGLGLWIWDKALGRPGLATSLSLGLLWLATLVLVAEHVLSAFLIGGMHFRTYRNILFSQALLNLGAAAMLMVVAASADVAILFKVVADLTALATLAVVLRRVSGLGRVRVDWALMASQARFGLQSHSATLINTSHSRIHLVVLSALGGDAAAGLFSVALLFVELVALGPNAIGTVLLPKLSGMTDRREAARMTAVTVRIVLMVSVAIAVLAWYPAAWIIGLFFGGEFRDVVDPARMVVIGAALATPVQILTRFFTSSARQAVVSVALGIAVGVAVIGSLVLIPSFGVAGAATAFIASSGTGTVLLIGFFMRLTGTPLADCVVPTSHDWALLKGGLGRISWRRCPSGEVSE